MAGNRKVFAALAESGSSALLGLLSIADPDEKSLESALASILKKYRITPGFNPETVPAKAQREILRHLLFASRADLTVIECLSYTAAREIRLIEAGAALKLDQAGIHGFYIASKGGRDNRLKNAVKKSAPKTRIEFGSTSAIAVSLELVAWMAASNSKIWQESEANVDKKIYEHLMIEKLFPSDFKRITNLFNTPELLSDGRLNFLMKTGWKEDQTTTLLSLMEKGASLDQLKGEFKPGMKAAAFDQKAQTLQALLDKNSRFDWIRAYSVLDEKKLSDIFKAKLASMLAAALIEQSEDYSWLQAVKSRDEAIMKTAGQIEKPLFEQWKAYAAALASGSLDEKGSRHSKRFEIFISQDHRGYGFLMIEKAAAAKLEDWMKKIIMESSLSDPELMSLSFASVSQASMDFYDRLLKPFTAARSVLFSIYPDLEEGIKACLKSTPEAYHADFELLMQVQKTLVKTNTAGYIEVGDHLLTRMSALLLAADYYYESNSSSILSRMRPGKELFSYNAKNVRSIEKSCEKGQTFLKEPLILEEDELECFSMIPLPFALTRRLMQAVQKGMPSALISHVIHTSQSVEERDYRLRDILLSWLYPSSVQNVLRELIQEREISLDKLDILMRPKLGKSKIELINSFFTNGLSAKKASMLSSGLSLVKTDRALKRLKASPAQEQESELLNLSLFDEELPDEEINANMQDYFTNLIALDLHEKGIIKVCDELPELETDIRKKAGAIAGSGQMDSFWKEAAVLSDLRCAAAKILREW